MLLPMRLSAGGRTVFPDNKNHVKPMQSISATSTESAQKLARIEGYLAQDAGNVDLLAMAIDLCLAQGRPEQADRHAQAALALYPNDRFFQYRYGNVLIAQGKLEQAQRVFETLHQASADVDIAHNLAYVYFRQGRFDDARSALLPYVDAPDIGPQAVTLFIRILHHLGQVKPALDMVARHAGAWPEEADFLAAASLLYLDDGQLERAQQFSAAAQAGNARALEAWVVGGTVALGQGAVEAAQAQFEEALKINPADGRTWSGLGLASLLKQDLAQAAIQLERAVEYLPSHIGTLHILGWCKILSQDLPAAETIFRKALTLDRNFGESHGGLAAVAALQGKNQAAEESIKRALGLDPRSLSARYAQMVISGDLRDPQKFRAAALRILAARQGPFGGSLADMVAQFSRR